MSRGLTWTAKETACLLDIWADDHIKTMLETMHKNADVFGTFSSRLFEKGFNRSPDQCHVKVKKLRQSYIKVRDALNKSGNSADEKLKCPWFDQLDGILSTRPVVTPVDIIETTQLFLEYLLS